MTITSNLFRKVWENIKCKEIKFSILLIRAAKLGRNLKHMKIHLDNSKSKILIKPVFHAVQIDFKYHVPSVCRVWRHFKIPFFFYQLPWLLGKGSGILRMSFLPPLSRKYPPPWCLTHSRGEMKWTFHWTLMQSKRNILGQNLNLAYRFHFLRREPLH